MDLKYCKARIKLIRQSYNSDSEAAATIERDLHTEFIRHVEQEGSLALEAMAKEILKSDKWNFRRG